LIASADISSSNFTTFASGFVSRIDKASATDIVVLPCPGRPAIIVTSLNDSPPIISSIALSPVGMRTFGGDSLLSSSIVFSMAFSKE
jgi:hypothetical protein